MSYAIITPQQTDDLTTLAAVKGDLNLPAAVTTFDAFLTAWITDASQAIADEIGHPLTRREVEEHFSGSGRMLATLDVTPVVDLLAVSSRILGDVDLETDDVRIENGEAGQVWRRGGWPDETPVHWDITVDPVPQIGEQSWEATYLGGWLTRADDIVASGVDAAGSVLTLPSGAVAPLLAPGDVIRLRGWTAAPNNRRFIVVAREEDAIQVDGTLTAETGGAGAVIEVRNVPSLLERACIDAVRAWYFQRTQNPTVTSEHIGDWSATYGLHGGAAANDPDLVHVLPPGVLKTIQRYKRYI